MASPNRCLRYAFDTRSETLSGVSAPTITDDWSTVRPASARTGATNAASRPSVGQPRPREREGARGDRAARHARDAVDALEPAGVMEAPDDPHVEQHGPVSAAREAEADAVDRVVRAHGSEPYAAERGACWSSLRSRSSARPRVGPMLPTGIPSAEPISS